MRTVQDAMIDNTTSNSSNASISSFRIVLWTVAFSLQLFVSIIGNSLIVWIVCKDNRLKTTTNYLVANMAVSDLLAYLFAFPHVIVRNNYDAKWLIGGDFGNFWCKFYPMVTHMSFGVSMYSCVFIAIDRYYAVAHPMNRPFRGKMKYIIAAIWIVSGLLSSPYCYFFGEIEYGNKMYCDVHPEKSSAYIIYYDLNFFGLNSVVVGVVVSITYTLTVYKLYKHKVPGVQSDFTRRRREQQNKNILKMCVTIVGLLYLSHGYWCIFWILGSQGKLTHLSRSAFISLRNTSQLMLYMSFVYNFFVYLIFNDIYRENIKTMITKCCFSCRSNELDVPRAIEGEIIEMMHGNRPNNA